MKMLLMLRRLTLLPAALVIIFLAGCQSYTKQTETLAGAWRTGNLTTAVQIANKEATQRADSRDELLWKLEQGTVLRASGDYEGSNRAFDEAEELVNKWEEEAKLKIGVEVGAILTNQANTPYRGRAYDKVMMNTYKALNYMALSNPDAARVELNRALQRQRDAVEENARRIEEAQAEAKLAKEGKVRDERGNAHSYDVDKAISDPKTGPALESALAELNAKIGSYADYVNPFSVFLDGLFFMTTGYDASDAERARKSIERAAAFNPANPYLQLDLQMAEKVANGERPGNLTYVIFETGEAPYRDQLRIDIPTFLFSSNLAYVGAAFPQLKFKDAYNAGLAVMTGGQLYNTSTISNMDTVVARDFKNEWPSILTKTLISAATKAALQYGLQKAVKDQGQVMQLVAAVSGLVYQAAMNQADLRSWMTLPKEFQYARLNTPDDGQLVLNCAGQSLPVAVEPGKINVVYVRSVTTNAKLLVSQFKLN